MKKKPYLGEFEELVLMTVARLGENADAVRIRDVIEELAGRTTTFGALYTTLDRLQEKGFVTVKQGEATPERGNRTRRLFQIQGEGLSALTEAQAIRARMLNGVNLGLQTQGR